MDKASACLSLDRRTILHTLPPGCRWALARRLVWSVFVCSRVSTLKQSPPWLYADLSHFRFNARCIQQLALYNSCQKYDSSPQWHL